MNNRIMKCSIGIVLLLVSFINYSNAGWNLLATTGKPVKSMAVACNANDTAVYVGTAGDGIYIYSTKTGLLSPFYTSYLDSFELFMRNVNSIFVNGVQSYAGTDSGLYHYNLVDRDSSYWGPVFLFPQGKVSSIAGTVFPLVVATSKQIYRNDSDVWIPLNPVSALPVGQNIPLFSSLALLIDSNPYIKIFAGSYWSDPRPWSGWSGVLESNNSGDNWSIHDSGLPGMGDVSSLCFFRKDFSDPLGIFACGTNHGVYYSNPNGKKWLPLKPGVIDNDTVHSMEVTIYSNSDISEIFTCTNKGAYLLTAFPNIFNLAEWHSLGFSKQTFCVKTVPQEGNYTKDWFVGAQDGLYRYTRDNVPVVHYQITRKSLMPVVAFPHGSIIVYKPRGVDHTTLVRLYDAQGKLLRQKPMGDKAFLTVDRKGLSAGVYIVSLTNNAGAYSTRIIIH